MATVATETPSIPKEIDSTKPQAMAIPKEGYFELEKRTVRPRLSTNSSLLWIHQSSRRSNREGKTRSATYGKTIQDAGSLIFRALATLKLHYLRWVLLRRRKGYCNSCTRESSTLISISTSRTLWRSSSSTGINTVFENLEGCPEDWKTNVPAFIKFVRDHQCPSFLEYGEYPYVTADEIKKALKLKAAFSGMLDLMQ